MYACRWTSPHYVRWLLDFPAHLHLLLEFPALACPARTSLRYVLLLFDFFTPCMPPAELSRIYGLLNFLLTPWARQNCMPCYALCPWKKEAHTGAPLEKRNVHRWLSGRKKYTPAPLWKRGALTGAPLEERNAHPRPSGTRAPGA